MRKLLLIIVGLTIILLDTAISAKEKPGFEILMSGNGDILSYIYFKQDNTYFIDTELDAAIEVFRYRRFFFLLDLAHEIYMGRKYNSDMVFDPNRGGWSFGLGGRFEFDRHFLDFQMHHDCFHDIGRWETQDFSVFWNTPRIGFGSKGYLPKYKYHRPYAGGNEIAFQQQLDYFVQAGFFGPRGNDVWQKNHDYEFTMLTNFDIFIFRYKRLGFDVESNNLWVINSDHNLKRKHGLNFDLTVYGDRGALIAYLGWWPYDSESRR